VSTLLAEANPSCWEILNAVPIFQSNSIISRLTYQVLTDGLLLRRVKESVESSLDALILSQRPSLCPDLKTDQEA